VAKPWGIFFDETGLIVSALQAEIPSVGVQKKQAMPVLVMFQPFRLIFFLAASLIQLGG